MPKWAAPTRSSQSKSHNHCDEVLASISTERDSTDVGGDQVIQTTRQSCSIDSVNWCADRHLGQSYFLFEVEKRGKRGHEKDGAAARCLYQNTNSDRADGLKSLRNWASE
jgi:hypothetical protein